MLIFKGRNFVNPIISVLLICFGVLSLFFGKEIIMLTNILLGIFLGYLSVEMIFIFVRNTNRVFALIFGILFLVITVCSIMNSSDILTRITFGLIGVLFALVFAGKYFFDKVKNKMMPSIIYKINITLELLLVLLSLIFAFSFLLRLTDLGLVLGIYLIIIGTFFIYLFILQLVWTKKHPVNITQSDLQKYISK